MISTIAIRQGLVYRSFSSLFTRVSMKGSSDLTDSHGKVGPSRKGTGVRLSLAIWHLFVPTSHETYMRQTHARQYSFLSMTQSLSDTAIDLPSTGKPSQDGPTSCDSQHSRYALCSRCLKPRSTDNGSPSAFVHLLDDDSTLIILSFCRPVILDPESKSIDADILGGGEWNRERWWHRLIQVCRSWRYLLLDSAFHLQVSLVCARGTPVADMLAHFPSALPIIIDHFDDDQELTAEDEKGILLALQHRDRVRRIRIIKPTQILQKLVVALDGEFPILEFLFIRHQRYHRPAIEPITSLNFPETFRAPHLRQLLLKNFATPIESPSLTTMRSLTTFYLFGIPSSAFFHPDVLLQRLAIMPQVETLGIGFNLTRDVERHLLRTPIMTQVTLPNLRWFAFRGSSAYLEVLLPWVTAPLVERLRIYFFNRMTYSIPHLRHFMGSARNLRLKTAMIYFYHDCLTVKAYPRMEAKLYNLGLEVGGRHLNWQVVSAAQVFHALSTVFSVVEDLTLNYNRQGISSEWNNEADRVHWRKLLESFGKVKNFTVGEEFVKQISRALQPVEEESPTELLPQLQKLTHFATGASRNAFTQFIEARQKVGHPITVVHL